jgi:formylglycine-generating enzyme required for sulfatase activity
MSLRADFFGELQRDEPLYAVHRQINVPPLREAELREVVSRPAALLAARFETDALAADIARRTAEESVKDAGALPLLSYLLDDMWTQMVARGDGMLRLPAHAMEIGGVLVERANAFIASHPKSEEALRRVLTLKLATVREDGEPTRRRALRSEFTEEEWRLVSELADHPNRLLATATPADGETYAEVAHEAIFRRWEQLREWIATEREFLIWRSELEAACRRWQVAPEAARKDALLMGLALTQAEAWLARRGEDLPTVDREFIEASNARDAAERSQRKRMRRQTRQMAALAGVLLLGIGAGLAWANRTYLSARAVTLAEAIWSPVLTTDAERALRPGHPPFKECADCPEMVVVPAGEFTMGSPKDEKGRYDNEGPEHRVTIARAFAVSRFEITSDEWDACVILGGCAWPAPETGWGRGRRPVMNVSWDDAQQYVRWLSDRTGKPYRLLTEAEWEYAVRAGKQTAYSWGDEVGKGNASCDGCGSQWDLKQTAPVGSFVPNAFGLYDMHGNVWEWVEDCYHGNYDGAPADGLPWIAGADCSRRVVRSGSWGSNPVFLRSAGRDWLTTDFRGYFLGFRVGRTLTP